MYMFSMKIRPTISLDVNKVIMSVEIYMTYVHKGVNPVVCV